LGSANSPRLGQQNCDGACGKSQECMADGVHCDRCNEDRKLSTAACYLAQRVDVVREDRHSFRVGVGA
jgi:hypothetical protein